MLSSYQARTNVSRPKHSYRCPTQQYTKDASEYPAHCDERRAFISGFNGSAGEHTGRLVVPHSSWMVLGCAIVTIEEAFLFTDGRYFLQAERQLDEYADFIPHCPA